MSCPALDPHPRTLRANIWRGLLSATDQEIRDGADFYPGAFGLCRFLGGLTSPPTPPHRVAGIYSVLSPMNGWLTNVSNVMDILRDRDEASVNTSDINKQKALAILQGSEPEYQITGRKTLAFFRAIANPDDSTPIPIDRHLISLALGRKITDPAVLSRLASKHYDRFEAAYTDLGRREGMGNRLASIAWFVQRRIKAGQSPIPHPDAPFCCNRPMHSHGHSPRRFLCPVCHSSRVAGQESPRQKRLRLAAAGLKMDLPPSHMDDRVSSDAIDIDRSTGRPLIYLPRSHPFRNSGGWQWLSRFVVMHHTGELLRTDEHVHHDNGNLLDCRVDNLKVMLAERHGRLHARLQLLYMLRDRVTGRFLPSPVPSFPDQLDDNPDANRADDQADNLSDDLSDIPF